jgi:hypothetical protein
VDGAIRKAKMEERTHMKLKRIITTAAALLLCAAVGAAALNFDAVAATVRSLFVTTSNSGKQDPSRADAVENGYVAEADGLTARSGDITLTLADYTIDKSQIALDYTLTGTDLDFERLHTILEAYDLEITDNTTGDAQVWTNSNDRETGLEYRTFPGGYFLSNTNTGEYGYVEGNSVYTADCAVTKLSDGVYSVVHVLKFKEPITVGDTLKIRYENLAFAELGDAADDDAVPAYTVFDGPWEFTISIDAKFKEVQDVSYRLVNLESAAQKGITVRSFTSSPLGSKLTLSVDFSKNGIADMSLVNPNYPGKLEVLQMIPQAADNAGNLFVLRTSDYTAYHDGVTDCWFEFDTLYFRNPETVTVTIQERGGETIVLEFAREA